MIATNNTEKNLLVGFVKKDIIDSLIETGFSFKPSLRLFLTDIKTHDKINNANAAIIS